MDLVSVNHRCAPPPLTEMMDTGPGDDWFFLADESDVHFLQRTHHTSYLFPDPIDPIIFFAFGSFICLWRKCPLRLPSLDCWDVWRFFDKKLVWRWKTHWLSPSPSSFSFIQYNKHFIDPQGYSKYRYIGCNFGVVVSRASGQPIQIHLIAADVLKTGSDKRLVIVSSLPPYLIHPLPLTFCST